MPELLDFLAPLPDGDEVAVENLLMDLGIKLDKPEKIWE